MNDSAAPTRFLVVRGTTYSGGWLLWDTVSNEYSEQRWATREEAEHALATWTFSVSSESDGGPI